DGHADDLDPVFRVFVEEHLEETDHVERVVLGDEEQAESALGGVGHRAVSAASPRWVVSTSTAAPSASQAARRRRRSAVSSGGTRGSARRSTSAYLAAQTWRV